MASKRSFMEALEERGAEDLGPVNGPEDLRDALADALAETRAWERLARRRLAQLVEAQRELEVLRRAIEGGAIMSSDDSQNAIIACDEDAITDM